MKLHLTGDAGWIIEGAEALAGELGITLAPDGLPVTVERGGALRVTLRGRQGRIQCSNRCEFFRALGLFVQHAPQGEFDIAQTAAFEKNGVMFDVSRGGVPTIDMVRYLLRRMALMGLNMLMLYTEDVYEVPGRPYFGYMRGRYSYEELKALDDYADMLGIEMVPCIQTLGHLETALRWSRAMGHITDTPSVLLVDCEETYRFLDEIIAAASAPFRSRRIHIGMDEAWNLGLGRYLKKNGYHDSYDIMCRHLSRVGEILKKHGLTGMMWGDMFFRAGSPTGGYYDMEGAIPDACIRAVPEGMQLIYWDYYHSDEAHYEAFIERYRPFGRTLLFAGSIWASRGPVPKYGRSFVNTIPALNACKKKGITQVINTIWCDDGSENSLLVALPGMQLYAEMGYGEYDRDVLAQRFALCTGAEFDSFMNFSRFDGIGRNIPDEYENGNITRCLLYQDPLLGLFDRDIEGLPLGEHYGKLRENLAGCRSDDGLVEKLYRFYEALACFMERKSILGVELSRAYRAGDRNGLGRYASVVIPDAMKRLDMLRARWRDLWFSTNKPMGWEILDIRLGGVRARLESTKGRLESYLGGQCDRLEELEEERLPFALQNTEGDPEFQIVSRYAHTVSASDLTQYLPF